MMRPCVYRKGVANDWTEIESSGMRRSENVAAGRRSGGDAEDFGEGFADEAGAFGDGDAGILERGDFGVGGAFAAGDDGAGVAHSAPGWSGAAGDEGDDR